MNRPSDLLRAAAAPIWEQYLEHPFVTGIGDGTLEIEKFRFYMLQDYLYLLDYAKVFALGVVNSRDPELMCAFAKSIHTILYSEMNIHRACMARLGITETQVQQVKPAQDNLSYTSYMLSVAHGGSPAEITVAILACSWSYAEIGLALAKIPGALQHPVYGEWIRGYASEEYLSSNEGLIRRLDELAADAPEALMQRLTEIFVRCSRYELSFWDMAWEMRA